MSDLLQIVLNVTDMIPAFALLSFTICWIIGILFMMKALNAAAKRSEMGKGQGSWGIPIAYFLTGAAFAAMPAMLKTLRLTFFAEDGFSDPNSIFEHAPATIGIMEGGEAQALIVGITTIVQFVGLIAVMRGLYMLNLSAQGGQGPKTFGPGLTFIIAGAMATNFPLFVGVVEQLITAGS